MQVQDTEQWQLAELLHNALCKQRHEMDQCWGLRDPYSLNQEGPSVTQRRWLVMADRVLELTDFVTVALLLPLLRGAG